MATVTATAGGGSDNDNGAVPDAKGRGMEVIGMEGNNEDCGADVGFLSMVVVRLRQRRKQQSSIS